MTPPDEGNTQIPPQPGPSRTGVIIHDGELKSGLLEKELAGFEPLPPNTPEESLPGEGERVVFYLPDDTLKPLLSLAIQRQWQVVILPHPQGRWSRRRFGLEGGKIAGLLQGKGVPLRLLMGNGHPVFSSVVVGESLSLDAENPAASRWPVFYGMLSGLGRLCATPFVLTTAKNQVVSTSAIGLIALSGGGHPYLGSGLKNMVAQEDNHLTLLVLAPRSILAFFGMIVRIALFRDLRPASLPGTLGILRSEWIRIESNSGFCFAIDGVPISAPTLELSLSDKPLQVVVGKEFPAVGTTPPVGKDVVRVAGLPSGEMVKNLIQSRLPFFNHATEDEFRELFLTLKENASFSRPFLALMLMSTLLALFGLYANSAPVIIGAMILAPLMSPIISLAMGIARSQEGLMRESLVTLTLGIGASLLCAMTIAALMPLQSVTGEMLARMSPTLLDLGVAVVSGVAGAYAHANKEVARSLAGVAIAVALVPPLCVTGIGLGWADWTIVRGAALLFATNLVGITAAAGLTFLALGFAPFRIARTGLTLTAMLMVMVTFPLFFSFAKLLEENRVMSILSSGDVRLAGRLVPLEPLSVRLGDRVLIHMRATVPEQLSGNDVENIRVQIVEKLGKPVGLELSVVLRRD